MNYIILKKTKKEINLITINSEAKEYDIFGHNFIQNNLNNIEIYINGHKDSFKQKYYLNQGENKITIQIKNPNNDYSYMFYNCSILKKLDGFQY